MAKLPRLAPVLRHQAARLTSEGQGVSRTVYRSRVTPWRRWYNTARWQKLRWSVLSRDLFRCQMCGSIEADTSKLVADHKAPHRGDPALFWNEEGIWCLCKSCHDGAKQREERRGGL